MRLKMFDMQSDMFYSLFDQFHLTGFLAHQNWIIEIGGIFRHSVLSRAWDGDSEHAKLHQVFPYIQTHTPNIQKHVVTTTHADIQTPFKLSSNHTHNAQHTSPTYHKNIKEAPNRHINSVVPTMSDSESLPIYTKDGRIVRCRQRTCLSRHKKDCRASIG